MSTALRCWSQDDPLAAMEWISKNGGNQSPLIREDTKRDMISAAARKDPALAFSLISRMEMIHAEQMQFGIGETMVAATTSEKRTAIITALSGYLASLKNNSREESSNLAIHSIASYAILEGYDAATHRVASSGLTPEELKSFATSIPNTVGWCQAAKSKNGKKTTPPSRKPSRRSAESSEFTSVNPPVLFMQKNGLVPAHSFGYVSFS